MKLLRLAKEWQPMWLLAFCLLPDHWHLVASSIELLPTEIAISCVKMFKEIAIGH